MYNQVSIIYIPVDVHATIQSIWDVPVYIAWPVPMYIYSLSWLGMKPGYNAIIHETPILYYTLTMQGDDNTV